MPRALDHVYNVLEELNQSMTIPPIHQTTLENRLVIAFTPLDRLERRKVPRSRQQIKLRSMERKAARLYLKILDEDPDIFIPFIITVSPKACESFDLSSFLQRRKKHSGIHLKLGARLVLEDIAQRSEIISRSACYTRLIKWLFQTPKPITTAESDEHWSFNAADLNAILTIFGTYILNAVEIAPIRVRERANCQTIQTTEAVRARFPHQNSQDAIFCLDIGGADEIAGILFPSASHPPSVGCEELPAETTDPDQAAGKKISL